MNYAVLMHVFNEETHLEKSIEAIKNQTLPPEFILIINDGSTDKTQEIIEKHTSEYFKHNPDDSKPAYIRRAEAFNIGVSIIKEKKTKLDGILKVDGDIVIEVFYAEKLLKHLHEPHTAAISGTSTEYNKTRNLNNGAVMYRLSTLPQARTISGWDLDLEFHLIGNGFNCVVDPTVHYTDLRPPGVFAPRTSRILRNRTMRKLYELKGFGKKLRGRELK